LTSPYGDRLHRISSYVNAELIRLGLARLDPRAARYLDLHHEIEAQAAAITPK